ncbi:transcriptional regulator with XRE-family HTH domain [Actinomadura algeriensis]|uniref:Transcriptional regulator with XRE-family HTH domain n=2 Tax=Actinomadura algeriensis TaxID=1679523 RepID=A0ABR9JNI9_9ACTN|nr:transcriptional regulator with XRE-family HTH domain [Actinomadura algeriensis]
MRQLRRVTKKPREEAAKYAGIAPATLSRIEAATHAPKPADILALCRFYGVDEEQTEILVTLARQSRQRGWWQRYGDIMVPGFEVYVGLEEEASELRSYLPSVVDGLLQTPGYIRAQSQASLVTPEESELERRVAIRVQRQERLLGAEDPPRMWTILHEGALRTQVGGAEVMREQLAYLHEVSSLNFLTLQVLPFTAGAHPAMLTGFHTLEFPHPADPGVTYIEYETGGVYLEQPGEVEVYARIFDQLRARAASPDDSRKLLEDIRRGL